MNEPGIDAATPPSTGEELTTTAIQPKEGGELSAPPTGLQAEALPPTFSEPAVTANGPTPAQIDQVGRALVEAPANGLAGNAPLETANAGTPAEIVSTATDQLPQSVSVAGSAASEALAGSMTPDTAEWIRTGQGPQPGFETGGAAAPLPESGAADQIQPPVAPPAPGVAEAARQELQANMTPMTQEWIATQPVKDQIQANLGVTPPAEANVQPENSNAFQQVVDQHRENVEDEKKKGGILNALKRLLGRG